LAEIDFYDVRILYILSIFNI